MVESAALFEADRKARVGIFPLQVVLDLEFKYPTVTASTQNVEAVRRSRADITDEYYNRQLNRRNVKLPRFFLVHLKWSERSKLSVTEDRSQGEEVHEGRKKRNSAECGQILESGKNYYITGIPYQIPNIEYRLQINIG